MRTAPFLRRAGTGLGAALLSVLLLAPAGAQDAQTLADLRADLQALGTQLGSLRQELVATGASSGGQVAGSALDRMNAIEAQLERMTSKTEELAARIDRVVSDGTNRLGDLEFRICEVEPGCDLGSVGTTKPLGGAAAGGSGGIEMTPTPAPPAQGGAELAVSEKADYDRAREVLNSGDFQGAVTLLEAFAEAYPGSPLMGEADYYRGEALSKLGDTAGAARAWLASFSNAPQGAMAADALYRLGTALSTLGQSNEACITLGEVPVRYPGSSAASQAQNARMELGCS